MSGFQSATPAGYQMVSTGMPGMGGLGYGGGFGLDTLLILLLLGGQNGGVLGNRGIGGPAANAVASDVILQPAFQSLQNQISGLASQFSGSQMIEQINNASDQTVHAISTLGTNTDNNLREIVTNQGNIRTDLATQNFNTLNSVNGLGNAITAQNTQSLIQSINQSQGTNAIITNGFNNQNLSTITGFNGLTASLCDLKFAMAQCCCETQKTIQASTQAILDNANSIQKENLIAQLNDSKNQVSNLQQTNQIVIAMQEQTRTILSHWFPYYPYAQSGNNGNNGNNSVRS